MPPGAERHVVARPGPGDVEDRRVGEHRGVAVRAGQHRRHQRPARQGNPGHFRGARREPAGQQDRRVVAQHLLDGVAPQLRPLAQHGELPGIAGQQGDPAAEEVDGRLEPGRQHQARGGLQLRLGEADAAVAGRDELAEQVGAGAPAQVLEVLAEPGVELAQRGLDVAERAPAQAEVEAGRGGRAQRQHLAEVGRRHAEDLADDRHREQAAVGLYEVERPARLELVEQPVGDLLDAAAQLLDRTRGEHAGDQLAVARVLGRVDGEQRRRPHRVQVLACRPLDEPAERRAVGPDDADAEVVAGQHFPDRGVRGGHPAEAGAGERPGGADLLEQSGQVTPVGGRHDHPPLEVPAPGFAAQHGPGERVAEAPPDGGLGPGQS